MKHIIIAAALCCMALLPQSSMAEDFFGKKADIVTEARRSNMDFTKIRISRCIRLTIDERTTGNIIVSATKEMLDKLDMRVEDGTFSAKINGRISNNDESQVVDIHIPNNGKVCSADISGVSSLIAIPTLRAEKFKAELAGVSRITANIEADKVSCECEGVSTANLMVKAREVDFEVEGSSNGTLAVEAEKCKLKCSGVSRVKVSGRCTMGDIEVKGTSKLTASELDVTSLKLEVEGCSKAKANAARCVAEVSGASAAEVHCTESLTAEVSGASRLEYSGACTTNIVANSGGNVVRSK